MFDIKEINIVYPTRKIFYAKLENNYKCYCSKCNITYVVDSKELTAIKHIHVCPKCKEEIDSVTNTTKKTFVAETPFLDPDEMALNGKFAGYIAQYHIEKAELAIDKIHHVLKEETSKRGKRKYYIKNCHLTCCFGEYKAMYSDGKYYPAEREWHERKVTRTYYSNGFLSAFWSELRRCEIKSAKEQLQEFLSIGNLECKYQIKSNQRYMMQHNLFSKAMISSMITFNLNNYDTLYKYAKETEKMRYHFAFEYNLNEYDFIYLCSKKISFNVYLDYLDQCKKLGLKNKHPKNFNEEHARLSEVITKAKNQERIEKANAAIKMFHYPSTKTNTISIKPYKTAEQIRDDAREFHICIYSNYLEEYAEKKTLLYRATIDNTLIACIELDGQNKKVVQVRGKHNQSVPERKQIEQACIKMMHNC